MIQDTQNTQDKDEESFLRHWSERVWDRAQLAQIAAVEESMVTYAMTAWRRMEIPPPADIPLLCSCEEGVAILSQNQFGEWRSAGGVPHKPPRAWMPCPPPERRP
jgi:hypothetical protein